MNILVITGQKSFSIIEKIAHSFKKHKLSIEVAPVSIAAFITKTMVKNIFTNLNVKKYDIVLLPGFVQWDAKPLEKELNIPIKKGPEFASDLPMVLKNLASLELSTKVSADKLFKTSGEDYYDKILKDRIEVAKEDLGTITFYINQEKSDLLIGPDLPPAIVAEIVNCTERSDETILKKVEHYIRSGADIVDIGCVANKPNPSRVREIIELISNHYDILLSIDSMVPKEINAAVDIGIDMILSFDKGNYQDLVDIPKDIPIIILPTKISEGYFPKEPSIRVKNLLHLTETLQDLGFSKLIADPLLETPISPGINNSLYSYFEYQRKTNKPELNHLKLPLFFGVSNVVELMDTDSIGINGLLATIAVEMDAGVLFTVEHSPKLKYGVQELHKAVKMNYIAKQRGTPPINQGIQYFRAKGKIKQDLPEMDLRKVVEANTKDLGYQPDQAGYFKIYVDFYDQYIYVQFFSLKHELKHTFRGHDALSLSKSILSMDLTSNLYHINYLGRELKKAEICLKSGKHYIQDEP